MEPCLSQSDRELGGHFLRDADLLGGKLARRSAEAQPADELAAGDHGHDHVSVDARGEQGLRLGAAGERGDVDHLRLPPPQGLHVAHQRQRKTDAGAETDAAAPRRRQPLHLAGRQVEQVHDGPRDPEQVPQPPEHRLRDRHRRLRRDERSVDLVQDPEAFGGLRERCLRLPELRDVDGHDQRRTPTGEVDGVRNDIDLSDPTILQSMRPGPRVSSNRGVRLRPKPGQDRLEAWHLLGRSDVGDAHGEKLFA